MPTAMTRRLLALAGLAVYWGLLFLATHLPGDGQLRLPDPIPHLDKIVHAVGFAGLAVIVCTVASGWWRPGLAFYLAVIGVLAAYAVLDESTQSLIRHRQPDVKDWLADLGGTIAGVCLFAAIHLLLRRRSPSDNA